MSNYNIYDTSFPNNWSEMMMYEFEWDLRPEFVPKVLEVIFTATAEILSAARSGDKPVAVAYKKANKETVAAAILQYFANEDDASKPGNWSLSWTFNEADIPDDANIIEGTDPNVYVYFRAVAASKFNMEYDALDVINTLNVMTLAALKKWLDENAKENDEVSISIDNVFVARVAVEGGVKVFALEPAAEIKMLIKDDAAIEK